tara:strand:+ start:444 stop:968 length:525 start_codon:yes stop_codon:yes gene_type:complete
MNKFLLPLFAVVAMIPILIIGLNNDPSKLPSQFIGKPAPKFNLPMLSDRSRSISNIDLKGEISLLNIWATWCAGCRAEHSFLMELSKNKIIPIFAINWRDNHSEALRFLEELGDPYIASGFDEDGRAGIDWGVYGAPETFLINEDGIVIYRYTGPLNRESWEKELAPLIAKLAN